MHKRCTLCRFQFRCFLRQDQGSYLAFQLTRSGSIFWLHARTEEPIRRIDQIPAHHAAGFAKIFHRALAGGVYLAPSGYEVNFMSFAHSSELLEHAHDAILRAVADSV